MANYREAGKIVSRSNRNRRAIFLCIIIVAIVFIFRQEIIDRVHDYSNKQREKEAMLVARLDNYAKLQDNNNITIVSITADSTLTSANLDYGVGKLIDNDIETCWQEGTDDYGKDCAIEWKLGSSQAVKYIAIYNGNQISEEKFWANNRVKEAEILIGDNRSSVILIDSMDPQIIRLEGEGANTDSIKIIIKSVYEGETWNDTCISEIKCYK